jgi:hypothetical protein
MHVNKNMGPRGLKTKKFNSKKNEKKFENKEKSYPGAQPSGLFLIVAAARTLTDNDAGMEAI